jgi:hypothetical protein
MVSSSVSSARGASSHQHLILSICCTSLLLTGMDVTIVNVALPAIQGDLHANLSGLQWVLDAYTLVVASLLMLAGSSSDRFGRRRIFQIGLGLFTAGSLLCSLAQSIGQLIAFRAVQGLGASMLNPVALSIIANAFPEPKSRARAVGIWGAVFSNRPTDRWSADAGDRLALDLLDQSAYRNRSNRLGSILRAGIKGSASKKIRSSGSTSCVCLLLLVDLCGD